MAQNIPFFQSDPSSRTCPSHSIHHHTWPSYACSSTHRMLYMLPGAGPAHAGHGFISSLGVPIDLCDRGLSMELRGMVFRGGASGKSGDVIKASGWRPHEQGHRHMLALALSSTLLRGPASKQAAADAELMRPPHCGLRPSKQSQNKPPFFLNLSQVFHCGKEELTNTPLSPSSFLLQAPSPPPTPTHPHTC